MEIYCKMKENNMKLFGIKNVREYNNTNEYIEKFEDKEIKKCVLYNDNLKKKYDIYYKRDSLKLYIPYRDLTEFQLNVLLEKLLVKLTHMFIVIDKQTKEERRLVYNNYDKYPIFPKEIIEDELNEELIYQVDKYCSILNERGLYR